MTIRKPSSKPSAPLEFDPTDPESVIAAIIAILGESNLACGPRKFAKKADLSLATVYRHFADASLRAKLLDSKPIIPFWEQVRFIAALPDWKPVAQRKDRQRTAQAKPPLSVEDAE